MAWHNRPGKAAGKSPLCKCGHRKNKLYARRYWWALLLAAMAAFTLGVGARARTTETNEANSTRPTPPVLRQQVSDATCQSSWRSQSPTGCKPGQLVPGGEMSLERKLALADSWDAAALIEEPARAATRACPAGLNGSGACWRRPDVLKQVLLGGGAGATRDRARRPSKDGPPADLS
jgi:hypothetical protein